MGISDWFKRKMAIVAMATAKVEKNAIGGERNSLSENIGDERQYVQGRLSDDLKRGEVTEAVKELRWRMYKVLEHTAAMDNKLKLKKMTYVQLDKFDAYPLEMVIYNEEIQMGMNHLMGAEGLTESDIRWTETDDEGKEVKRRTLGEISLRDLDAQEKPIYTLMLNREFPAKVNIENYTKKVVVRTISEEEKLLEFYISKYTDELDRKTFFLVSEIKKALANPRSTNIIDITDAGFITTNTSLNVDDHLLFEYEITGFDKIIEHQGHYVIKFKANVLVSGERLFEEYRLEELDKKYETKAKKGE